MNWNDCLLSRAEMLGSSKANLRAAPKLGEYAISETIRDHSICGRRSHTGSSMDFIVVGIVTKDDETRDKARKILKAGARVSSLIFNGL